MTQCGNCLTRSAKGAALSSRPHQSDSASSGYWTWRRKSRIAFENDLDFTTFYLEWNGHTDFLHVLMDIAQGKRVSPPPVAVNEQSRDVDKPWEGDNAAGKPLPPYARGLNTPAKPEAEPRYNGSPFPPPVTEASPRVRASNTSNDNTSNLTRPDSPLVRDLRERLANGPANPVPLDRDGRRTIARIGGTPADDRPEHVTGRN